MRGNKDEKLKLAELAVSESDTMKKVELLSAFMGAKEGFPLSHTLLFEYAQSSYRRLRKVSLEILTNSRSEALAIFHDISIAIILNKNTKCV